MKFYIAGHQGFGNRGCEALIRGTVISVRKIYHNATFYVPSNAPDVDRKQWPDAGQHGVTFTKYESRVSKLIWWSRFYKLWSGLPKLGRPSAKLDRQTIKDISACDAVIVSGGDVLSFDYGLYSLYLHAAVIDAAIMLGKPVHIWAASIGSFEKNPVVESQMVKLLSEVSSITVRESRTLEYMRKLGLEARLVGDQAFLMKAEEYDGSIGSLSSSHGILGFNVSPLVRETLGSSDEKSEFDSQISQFLRDVVEKRNLSILLVPHVGPLVGPSDGNCDHEYMASLMQDTGLPANRISLLPKNLNAAQLKSAIGKCRFFIGARTHSTIGAWSQQVPTGSISYSVKAQGLNEDIFGTSKYMIATTSVNQESLNSLLDSLEDDELSIRGKLSDVTQNIQKSALTAAEVLK